MNKTIKSFFLYSGLLLFGIFAGYFTNHRFSVEREAGLLKKIIEIENNYTLNNNALLKEKAKRDSVEKMNVLLYSQKQLTGMIAYRDSMINLTGFTPGDIITLLPSNQDTLIVLEVIAGGNRYSHHVDLLCLKSDGMPITLSPQVVQIIKN